MKLLNFEQYQFLNEGGAYGHMSHPFEDTELTFNDFKQIITMACDNLFEPSNFVSEKTDGIALSITIINGEVRAARNKGQLKNKGANSLTINMLDEMFAGRGDLQVAFITGMRDISAALSNLSPQEQKSFFNNGEWFMAIEVISPQQERIIPYGENMLIMHGLLKYDENGNAIDDNKKGAKEIEKIIQKANAHIQSKFYIKTSNDLSTTRFINGANAKSSYLSELDSIVKKYDLKYNDSLLVLFYKKGKMILQKQFNEENLDILVKRMVEGSSSVKLTDIKKLVSDDTYKEFVSYEKSNAVSFKNECLREMEILFLKVGKDFMKSVTDYMVVSSDAAISSMKSKIEKSISDIKTKGDASDVAALMQQLERLQQVGTLNDISPAEGVCFVYKGKTYKFTGIFAIINRIAAILDFKK